jgi:hypothetical protein
VPAGTHTISAVDGFGTCTLVCQTGWLDCDKNTINGCETPGATCPYDAGFALPELVHTLVGTPRGLAVCGGDVYWSTLSDPNADAAGVNGVVWAMSRVTNMPSALATSLDPGRGIDSRGDRVYWLARSGLGDAGMLAYVTGDGGVVAEMTASETDAYKVFALAEDGDYSLANGSIWFAPLASDAGAPFTLPHDAGTASSLLAVGGSPFAIVHGAFGFYDAGTDAPDDADTDADASTDDADASTTDDADATDADDAGDADLADADDGEASSDAGADVQPPPPTDSIVALGAPAHVVTSGFGKIVTSTAGTYALVATDDTVYVVNVATNKSAVVATNALHIVDVAIDATYAYWTTVGQGTAPGAVWRVKLPW